MSADLTKLNLHSEYNAFKNNAILTGTCTISGNTSAGANVKTFLVDLGRTPDMVDIVFNGATGGGDPRPAGGWFHKGAISVATNNAGGGNPSSWKLHTSIAGGILTISAEYVQQFTTVETLTSTNFSYRVIDYSVF